MLGHAGAVGEAGCHEPVGEVGDPLEGGSHEGREPDALHVRAGLGVVVEDQPVVLVDDVHPVACGAQAVGGVDDPRTDAEDGVEERDRGHGAMVRPVG